MTATEAGPTPAAELDAACLRMLPIVRRFVAAVGDRDPVRVRAAWVEVYDFDAPDGRSALAILALVLADELVIAETVPADERAAGKAVRTERERCRQLAAEVLAGPLGDLPNRARRLPRRIASGDRP